MAVVAAIAVGLLLALTGTAVGAPAEPPDRCRVAEAKGQGMAPLSAGAPVSEFAFDVCHPSFNANDVSGRYAAKAAPGQPAPQGPVVCSDFEKNAVAFLYRVDEKTPPGSKADKLVLVYAIDGGPGPMGDKLGYAGPAPAEEFKTGCQRSSPQATTAKQTAAPITTGDIAVVAKF